MKLEYYGHSCFKLTTSYGVSILTDPFTKIGYELPPALQASIVTSSHDHFDHNYFAGVEYKRTVTGEGVFSYEGVKITGVATKHDEKGGALRGDNTVYLIEADGLTFCHLGDLGEVDVASVCARIPKPIDVLFVPVGGTYTVDAKTAKKYVDALSPKLTVPMHFKTPDCNINIESVESYTSLLKRMPSQVSGELELTKEVFETCDTLIFKRKRI